MHWNKLPAQDQAKIFDAFEELAKDNPDVVKILTKLADLKKNEPKRWAMGLKLLKLKQ